MNTAHHTASRAVGEAAPTVTLLTTGACHLCEDAHTDLLNLASQGRIALDRVTADSARGRTLLAHHRPALFPLVLLDDEFFSAGRLPRRKLDRALASRKAS